MIGWRPIKLREKVFFFLFHFVPFPNTHYVGVGGYGCREIMQICFREKKEGKAGPPNFFKKIKKPCLALSFLTPTLRVFVFEK